MKRSTKTDLTTPSPSPAEAVSDSRIRMQQASDIFDQMLEQHQIPEVTAQQFGDLIDQFRQLLRLPAKDFAERLGVSLSSYSRWRSGEAGKPPLHRVRELKTLLWTESLEEKTKHSIFFDDYKRITIRPYSQLLDRQNKSLEAWSFKHLLPYRGGAKGEIREQIVDLLTDTNSQVVFHCVFLGPKLKHLFDNPTSPTEHSRFPALDSFAELKKAVAEKDAIAAQTRIRGWMVYSAASAFKLGLANQYVGTTLLVYDPVLTAPVPNLRGRKVDIFHEVPLSIYRKEDYTKLIGGHEFRWLEIDPELSDWHYQFLKPSLERIQMGEYDGVTEFLATPEQLKNYRVRKWI